MSEPSSEFANSGSRARAPLRVALVGCGAIGLSRHLPVLRQHPRYELAALVDPRPQAEPEPQFETLAKALASGLALDAVVLATPPQVRADLARMAIASGLGVLLEKPPAVDLGEARRLAEAAQAAGVTLFAAWHSRFASRVSRARQWLQGHRLRGGRMTWREDVRKWHPGQDWIWRRGGMGVFDPGMNGFSVLTLLYDDVLSVRDVHFQNHLGAEAPVRADLVLEGQDFTMSVSLDFMATDGETWRFDLERDDGGIAVLDQGGARWCEEGGAPESGPDHEYEGVYDRFSELLDAGRSEVDLRPLQLVQAAFSIAEVERLAEPPP